MTVGEIKEQLSIINSITSNALSAILALEQYAGNLAAQLKEAQQKVKSLSPEPETMVEIPQLDKPEGSPEEPDVAGEKAESIMEEKAEEPVPSDRVEEPA